MNPTIRRGDTGPAVADLQRLVHVRADGEFGPVTERAVRAFQTTRGIDPDGIVGPHTWAALVAPTSWPPVAPLGAEPGAALVDVIVQMLGVSEGPVSNRGDRVDDIIRKGGFNLPSNALTPGPPWCAWAVSAAVAICEDAGYPAHNPPEYRGLAVGRWLTAPDERRISVRDIFEHAKPGDVLCRTRISAPVSDTARVLVGFRRQGHTGVVEAVDREHRTLHVVAGNSSGHGHARTTGAVAREAYREGDAGWQRIVGLVRVMGGA